MPIRTKEQNNSNSKDQTYKVELSFLCTAKQIDSGIVSNITSSLLAFWKLTPLINSKLYSLNIEKADEDDYD